MEIENIMKRNGQTSIIKPIYDKFLAVFDYCISVMRLSFFQLYGNNVVVSALDISYADQAAADDLAQNTNCKVTTASILLVAIDQDSASEIRLLGIYLNNDSSESGHDDFIVGFQADMWW